MSYTNLFLFFCGLLGIVLHHLVEINKLNKQPNGNFSFKTYAKLEWASMLISIIVVVFAVMSKDYIKDLKIAGKVLCIAYGTFGYMSQSLLTAFTGKAQKIINKIDTDAP